MSDAFYSIVCLLGRHPFWMCSRPIVINSEVTNRVEPYILASTHRCPYDIPVLMRHTRRRIDFVSIVEVFQRPYIGWFYRKMNAFPLDRSQPDSPTVRIILERLSNGRVIGMFPEGGFRTDQTSAIATRNIKSGIGRLALIAKVPIIPAVLIGTDKFSRSSSWLPFRNTQYGIIYGDPIHPNPDPKITEEQLIDAYISLYAALKQKMNRTR